MRGMLSTAGVHDLAHGNQPKFVAMAAKQPDVNEMCKKNPLLHLSEWNMASYFTRMLYFDFGL